MLKFKILESPHLKNRNLREAEIEAVGVGALANCMRRILLDEIPMLGLSIDNAVMQTNDAYLTYQLLQNIALIRVYEECELYLKISIKGDSPKTILSNDLKTLDGKTPNIEQNVEICELSGNSFLHITGIKTVRGIGREHAKFSAVVGTVTYTPTDVIFVYYLNEKGFIEVNMRCIPRDKYDLDKKYIIWNDKWAKNISKKDEEYSGGLIKIKYTGKYLSAENDYCNDYIIRFKTENPEIIYKLMLEVIKREVEKKISFDNFGTIEQYYTVGFGEAVKYFCWQEIETSLFGNYKENNYKITIDHIDREKILNNALNKIKLICKF